jgi:hypothetical protein
LFFNGAPEVLLGRLRLGELKFEASLGKQFMNPISKITREKRTGGVAQVIEHLLC